MIKNEWCIILWHENLSTWVMMPGTRETNFKEHQELFEAHRIQHPEGHVKSIHTCWLDDIKNWDGPEQTAEHMNHQLSPLPLSCTCPTLEQCAEMQDQYRCDYCKIQDAARDALLFGPADKTHTELLDVEIDKLNPHDRREFRKFQKYLAARQKYGDQVLLKRKFWRKYLGLE